MEPYEKFTREIVAGGRGKSNGAFFDFDGTIIATHSVRDMFIERFRSGEITGQEIFDIGAMVSSYLLHTNGFEQTFRSAVEHVAGTPERSLVELGEKITREHLAAEVFPEMRAMIRAHQQQGHSVAIVSSATRYQIEPLAKRLGIDDILCTELEVVDGRMTGGIEGEVCYADAKLAAVRDYAKRRRIRLARSWFYSDGAEDAALLDAVGHPVAINPDGRLADIARHNGWRELHLESRGAIGLGDIARSVMIYASAVPFLAAGLPMRALGISERDATNFSISAWSSVATAIARLKLIVEGEEHLWSHRPAVFVFNHQSAVDVLITARLLREDIVAVAKKEIRHQVPMGPAFSYTGAVFIDREHVGDPRLALRPAVEALHDGRSVVIAPEGTRSSDGTLGRFKLGAFHLAREAGVPVVPIVIHNAQDALPYKTLVVRPAEVKVTVLEPVITDGWVAADVARETERVRSRYLDVLGQAGEVCLADAG